MTRPRILADDPFLPVMAIATGSTFTTKDVHEPALDALRRDTTEYSLASLRYDLSKLRAKGLVEKVPPTHTQRSAGRQGLFDLRRVPEAV